jgi:hypothetical protein
MGVGMGLVMGVIMRELKEYIEEEERDTRIDGLVWAIGDWLSDGIRTLSKGKSAT